MEVTSSLTTLSVFREQTLRRGPLNMLMINLASSIKSYPRRPTQTDKEQLKELDQAMLSWLISSPSLFSAISALTREIEKQGLKKGQSILRITKINWRKKIEPKFLLKILIRGIKKKFLRRNY